MRRNVSGQVICAQLVSKTDGSDVTSGTTTVYVLGDGGTQGSGGGTVTHEGNGCWSYLPTQAETNYAHVAYTFVNSSAVSVTVQVYPTQYDASGYYNVSSGTGTGQISLSSGQVTVATNNDKTGYTASTVSDKTGYSLAADQSAVTIGTVNTVGDKTGYSLADATSDAVIADAVWNALTSGYGGVGSYGEKVESLDTSSVTVTTNNDKTGYTVSTVSDKTGYSLAADQSGVTIGTVNAIASGGITAASIATDAVDADALAADALAEIKTQVVAALNTDTYAEPGQTTPLNTTTLVDKIGHMYKYAINKSDNDGTTLKIYNSDGSTVGQKSTIGKTGSVITKGALATGP